jgi:hypothetical protein
VSDNFINYRVCGANQQTKPMNEVCKFHAFGIRLSGLPFDHASKLVSLPASGGSVISFLQCLTTILQRMSLTFSFSYYGKDKPDVRTLALALRVCGPAVWLDEE